MKENAVPPLSEDFDDYFLPWYHLGYVDPVTRRVKRPIEYSDVNFYKRLMFEATSLMPVEEEDDVCLFEQEQEVARDPDDFGPTACLLAAEDFNKRGFSGFAYRIFEEIARKALIEKDVETLKCLIFSLEQCRLFAENAANDLTDRIFEEHPEVLPSLPKKKNRSK